MSSFPYKLSQKRTWHTGLQKLNKPRQKGKKSSACFAQNQLGSLVSTSCAKNAAMNDIPMTARLMIQKPCTPTAAAAVGPIGDRDKLKQASVQALTAKASQASVPVSTSYPKLSLTDTKGPESPVLKGVPPGPHAVNLLDIAIIYHQDMQETARWLPAGYKHLDEEQHATAAEAMQNYVTSADLLKQLCQGDTPHLSLHTNRAAPAQSAVVVAQGQGVNPLHGNIHQEMQENDFFDQEPSSARYSSNSLDHSALVNKCRVTKQDMQPSAAQADELPPCRSCLVL
ncbi:hypothetical protein WJX77_004331 [Trebouxia sp. C0004]